jgi:hypothetical protein
VSSASLTRAQLIAAEVVEVGELGEQRKKEKDEEERKRWN